MPMVVELGDVELVLQSVIDLDGDVDGSSSNGLSAIGSGLMAGNKLPDCMDRFASEAPFPNTESAESMIARAWYSFDCVIEHGARFRDVNEPEIDKIN